MGGLGGGGVGWGGWVGWGIESSSIMTPCCLSQLLSCYKYNCGTCVRVPPGQGVQGQGRVTGVGCIVGPAVGWLGGWETGDLHEEEADTLLPLCLCMSVCLCLSVSV